MPSQTSPRRLIRNGFWFGVGLALPLLITLLTAFVVQRAFLYPLFVNWEAAKIVDGVSDEMDRADQVAVVDFRKVQDDQRTRILGTLENKGSTPVASIRMNADFLDEAGKLVFQCSDGVGIRLKAGEKGLFQINCPYREDIPPHASIAVTVTAAGPT